MENNDLMIRIATVNDAEELLSIYEPYVKKTAVSFEYEAPSLREFKARIEKTLRKYPYLVAQSGAQIAGYAYTGEYSGRTAYDRSAETSIYVREGKRRTGVGRALYAALEEVSRAQNILNLYACAACPESEDEYLNRNSIGFHEHIGYKNVGEFHKCGYKFGRWYGVAWMEKLLGEHKDSPKPFLPFPELDIKTILNKSF